MTLIRKVALTIALTMSLFTGPAITPAAAHHDGPHCWIDEQWYQTHYFYDSYDGSWWQADYYHHWLMDCPEGRYYDGQDIHWTRL